MKNKIVIFVGSLLACIALVSVLIAAVGPPPILRNAMTTNQNVWEKSGSSMTWTGNVAVAGTVSSALTGTNGTNLASYLSLGVVLASDYGFSPTNSGDGNMIAITNALFRSGSKPVMLTGSGIFQLNGTIFLDDNKTLIGTPGCVLQKSTNYGNVFVNRGLPTLSTNVGISLINLYIDFNNFGQGNPTNVTGWALGQIDLATCSAFRILGCTLTNAPATTPNIVLHGCWNGRISGLTIGNSAKDGIDFFPGCHDIVCDNLDMDTFDDPILFAGVDYPNHEITVGDVSGISIHDVIFRSSNGNSGNVRFYPGAWTNWVNGFTYQTGDHCVSAGKIYQCSNDPGFSAVGANAPTHSSGSVTGGDGITWSFRNTGTNTVANITDISIDGVQFKDSVKVLCQSDNSASNRNLYPNCEYNCIVDSVYLSHLTFQQTNSEVFCSFGKMHIGSWKIRGASQYTGTPTVTLFRFYDQTHADNIVAEDVSLTGLPVYPAGIVEVDTNCLVQNMTFINHKMLGDVTINPAGKWMAVAPGSGDWLKNLVFFGGMFNNTPDVWSPVAEEGTNSISFYGVAFTNIIEIASSTCTNSRTSFNLSGCTIGDPSSGSLFSYGSNSNSITATLIGCKSFAPINHIGTADVSVTAVGCSGAITTDHQTSLVVANTVDTVGNITVGITSPGNSAGYIETNSRFSATNHGCILLQNGTGNNFGLAEVASDTWSLGYFPSTPDASAISRVLTYNTSGDATVKSSLNATNGFAVAAQTGISVTNKVIVQGNTTNLMVWTGGILVSNIANYHD